MDDQRERFLEENTNHPVNVVNLDEPDEVDQPTEQVLHLNDQVPQGNEVAGASSSIAQTPSGNTDEDLLKRIQDPDLRAAFAKKFKDVNMDKTRETSRVACKARLGELFKPINQKLDTDMYDGEEGYTLYRTDKQEAIEAYQNTPGLGLMKGTELDDYLDAIHSERPIERMDENAKLRAEQNQGLILELLTSVMEQFEAFMKLFQAWLHNRSDNINWLKLKADSLDKEQKKTNKIIVAGSATSTSVAGIVTVALGSSPVTFGGSLAIGLVVGLAGAGVTNSLTEKQRREYEVNNYDEALARLETDTEQTDKMMSIIDNLELEAILIREEIRGRADGGEHVGWEEVAAAAQVVAVASKRLRALALCFGLVSIAKGAYTLVKTIKDIKDGSKSKLATSFREAASKLEQQVLHVVSISEDTEKMVNKAQDVLTPLLKKYPLTIGRNDNE